MKNCNFWSGVFRWFFILGLIFSSGQVLAHAKGENYVWLDVESDHLVGRFEIRVHDLRKNFGLSLEGDAEQRVQELRENVDEVQSYLLDHFAIWADGQELELEVLGVEQSEGTKNWFSYYFRTPTFDVPETIRIENSIFLTKEDFLHRSLLLHTYNKRLGKEYGDENAIMVFSPQTVEQTLSFAELPEVIGAERFLMEGVLHTLLGLDHVLFILALLITSVLLVQRDENGPRWQAVDTFGRAFWNVLKIVTLFTLAHSVTLSLAALGLVSVNSRFVESVIALSIIAIAANNIYPRFNDRQWLLLFIFGLFHGLGFASVMGDLPFRTVEITKILIRFNIGIEIGQVLIVLVVFPILYFARKQSFYRPVVQVGLSLVILAIAVYWFIERAFGFA